MKMETANYSETLVHISQTKERDIRAVELWEVHGTVVLPVLEMK